jgi:uncharacterized protein YciI
MKLLIIIFLLSTLAIYSQTENPKYDSTLAKTLGADDFGMKKYVLVILKTGSNTTKDTVIIKYLFSGHMSNMARLAQEGKLIVAGPIVKNDKNYRGIFILNVATFDEATKLLETDPAVREKLLEAELYLWYGSAALPQYLLYDDKIWKKKP